jgi:hypothetical protein
VPRRSGTPCRREPSSPWLLLAVFSFGFVAGPSRLISPGKVCSWHSSPVPPAHGHSPPFQPLQGVQRPVQEFQKATSTSAIQPEISRVEKAPPKGLPRETRQGVLLWVLCSYAPERHRGREAPGRKGRVPVPGAELLGGVAVGGQRTRRSLPRAPGVWLWSPRGRTGRVTYSASWAGGWAPAPCEEVPGSATREEV